jgi:hypothetical protein
MSSPMVLAKRESPAGSGVEQVEIKPSFCCVMLEYLTGFSLDRVLGICY